MNNRNQLRKEILEFLESNDEKIMLITGTHQYEKHFEVLGNINQSAKEDKKVLFRINHANNIESLLKIKSDKLNTKIKIDKLNLYIDTINSRTWKYEKYDISIIYPIDSVCKMKEKQREEIINNLLINTVDKLFIVSWTDNVDYSWLDKFGIDRKAVFDAEEENIEYHNRVLDRINNIRK